MTNASERDERIADALEGAPTALSTDVEEDLRWALAGRDALAGLFTEVGADGETLADDRRPPDLPPDYEVLREIGRGGMGVVYLVRQTSLHRDVALKVLRPGEHAGAPQVQRFLDEARHLARLRHPQIVTIHEIGDAGGEPYFTMDYIDGEPLSARLQRGPLPPSQTVEILKQIAAAVQHAHKHGIIHRDLKPSNVLLDASGQVFVTDFGLARDLQRSSGLTLSGELLGTPQYMAPEQARGESHLVGEATDVHALGAILYEMLTGRSPYAAASTAETLVRLLKQLPEPPRRIDHRIPRDLETICLRMLEKDAAARYASVSALLEDVRRYESGEPLLARRPSVARRAWWWCRRSWKSLATVAVTAALVLAAAPMLFDKSYEDLVAWGDEELASGHAGSAAPVYLRALRKASEAQRPALIDRIVRTARDLRDPAAAVELALKVVDDAPGADFGRYNYLVAQALVARVRTASPAGVIDIWHIRPQPELELVRARLELALRGMLTESERAEADRTLEAVNLALAADKPWARIQATYLSQLPEGTPQELQAILDHPATPHWNRGLAALQLARLAERTGTRTEAVAAYRQAYRQFQLVFPTVGGIKVASGANPSRVNAPDSEECSLVRQTAAALHRLAPAEHSLPTGGIEFEVTGWRPPASVGIDLVLVLCDPEIDNPDAGLPHSLPRLVPLPPGGRVRVQVLDGLYRLQTRGHHARWDQTSDRESRLLQVEPQGWPTEVRISGGVLTLPPVDLRLADEIRLLAPVSGVPARLDELELAWGPVDNAARYQVQLLYSTETPQPTTVYFHTVSTAEPRLLFSQLKDVDRRQVRDNLLVGRTGGWRVDAYDASGRIVGKSIEERQFLVAQELADRP